MPTAETTDFLVQPTACLHGSCNQHSPSPPMNNSIPSFSNMQGSAIPSEKFVEGSSANEKLINASRTGQDGLVYVVSVDAEFNKKVNNLSQHSGRNTVAHPSHSTPLLVVTGDDNTCVRLEQRATVKVVFILVLLSTALRVLLQTNLPTQVTCHLLFASISASSYLVLLAMQSHKKFRCAALAADVCFGVTAFEMALAVILQVQSFARSSVVGS